MTQQQPVYECHKCGSDMQKVENTDGTYRCDCGAKTHEKIEAIRNDIEDLADSDTASRVARLLAGDAE